MVKEAVSEKAMEVQDKKALIIPPRYRVNISWVNFG